MKVIHTRIQSTTPQKSASTSQGKPYKCNVGNCTKSFKSRYDLREHYRTHTGEKPYQCTKSGCDSKFSALGNLKTHERQHTNERPYKCEKCDWAFTRKFTLTVHQKTHELIRPSYYVCPLDYCFKQFRRLGNLKTHHNKTHAVTIGRLTDQFASIKDGDIESAADKDKELWDYFTNLYKNSSKGMKLRGKDREVKGADGGHSMVGTGREN
ncbi:uncharacterized protein LY89DRAFT_589497 [Mollisia scopiformis]|uniref:C2H2 type master regulator of conidiophore development brlA n=1 Tax=Mollisia scopiformis TaxID=149040 RepID=A0A194X1S0_MOLSC|nr:uncharacterized protein LY89DRAFT_589497 [Mollisia scopiformis]KUJ14143.1 hypothetical protein LY89DRAFT_589497 [Mollisia scopiformis]